MERKCPECGVVYDDADQDTICDHPFLRSPEMKEQWLLGKSLLGKRVRFRHMPPGSGSVCTSLYFNGMVSIDEFPGEFAPHLFVEDEGESISIPVEGTVS